jgi:hypothetical protein
MEKGMVIKGQEQFKQKEHFDCNGDGLQCQNFWREMVRGSQSICLESKVHNMGHFGSFFEFDQILFS